ncbi:MAG: AarF/ABC1/UbiB kinase family protein [Rhodothermales bacterium]|nr:AarF/ABC1/UbiB kinase family protein [Rhodothermales bacterium]
MTEDRSDQEQSFPSSRLGRGKIAAKTGLKIGANYARYLARRSVGAGDAETERSDLHGRNAQDLFKELVKLRGTALKLAQGMSINPGILPEEFATVLSQAQYQVPPMNSGLVRSLIRKSLGDYPENVFASFEPQALAAASLGQVHRARLPDGRAAAVKIQYPNVRESIESDLRVIRGIAQRVMGGSSIEPYLEEVRVHLWEETDYLQEGKYIEFFAGQYQDERVITPRWVPEFTTQTVLTMTFVEGLHLDSFLATNPSQERRDQFGQRLFDFVHEQVAADNLTVHADAHPGNFLFRRDGKIGVLDFGCVKVFPRSFRDDLLRLFRARLEDDEETLMRQYRALEILQDGFDAEQEAYLLELIHDFGQIIVTPYRKDSYDFGDSNMLDGFKELLPKVTGREAFKHREPVGSPHFVFVNRLVAGLLSLLTRLEARIDVRKGRELLFSVIE